MVEIHCIITGVVQNVAYRAYAQDEATERGITGWVRNRRDGAVEVVAQGTPDILKEYIETLHEGSLAARVEGVAVEWRNVVRTHDDFAIRHD